MKKIALDYGLKVRFPITIFIIIIAFTSTYFISRPERDSVGYAPEQPIKFSHKLHAGKMSIDCQYCHTNVEKGRFATIPSPSICMNCHSVARADKPEIIKLTKYYKENQPIPWKRVHKVPDYAYFNHSVHVNKGIDCKHCHEDVTKLDVIAQLHSFTMANCLSCHRDAFARLPEIKAQIKKGPDNCWACHR
ncbi:MAG: cytochrome c3 family protein [FCB group bacterium]|jgi:hypothetical protein